MRSTRSRSTIGATFLSPALSHTAQPWSAEGKPRLPGVDAGEALPGVCGGVAGGAAEGRRGREGALGVLGLGEVVAVVGDDELEAELAGCGGGQGGAPPQLADLTAERREIGLRPLA